MKKTMLFLSLWWLTGLLFGQATTPIPDAEFENALINLGIDTNGATGDILNADAERVNSLSIPYNNIHDLTGIEAFIHLDTLICYNGQITGTLDLTSNTELIYLRCNNNQIDSLNVTACNQLIYLNCTGNQLTHLDVSGNPLLQNLSANHNAITGIDLSHNPSLTSLQLGFNGLTSVDLSNNPNLSSLYLSNNSLQTLDVTPLTQLTYLNCVGNQLSDLDLHNNTQLSILMCGYNLLSSLDLSANPQLTSLYCSHNSLSALSVDIMSGLTQIDCSYNQITSLDLSANSQLTKVFCNNNQLTWLDLRNGNNTAIGTNYFNAFNNNLTCIQVDDAAWSAANWPNVDSSASYSENCTASVDDAGTLSPVLYPDPARDYLHLSVDHISEIRCFDLSGKQVPVFRLPGGTLDIRHLHPGVYHLYVRTSDQRNYRQSFIKTP